MKFESLVKNEMPSNIEAEELVLGSILFDSRCMEKVAHKLSLESFFVPSHRFIYATMSDLFIEGKTVDPMNVAEKLRSKKQLDDIGGYPKLASLFENTVTSVKIEEYALLVQEKYNRRRLIEVAGEIKELAFDGSRDIADVVNEAERLVFSLRELKADERGLHHIEPAVCEVAESFNEEQAIKSLDTGFVDLDRVLGGFCEGRLYVIASRPGAGKSTFSLNIAQQICKRHDKASALFTLEMGRKEIAVKLLSSESCVNSQQIALSQLPLEKMDQVFFNFNSVTELPLYIDDSPNPTIQYICSQVRRLKSEHKELGCVVIDYLQLLETSSEFRVLELGKITRACKQLARECEVPIILISQLNRSVEQRANKRPIMSDLRESGSIEQDANCIILLYRDDYYDPESVDKGLVEVNVVKNRDGNTETFKMIFRKEYSQFINYKQEEKY